MTKVLSKKDRFKAYLVKSIIAFIIRFIGRTLIINIEDNSGVSDRNKNEDKSLIWTFWHNRIFIMPYIYERFANHRKGYIFTSPSGDGEIIARVLKSFGVDAIRGSSNKRPISSLKLMFEVIKNGKDVVITPDGPRGPREVLNKGVIGLGKLDNCLIMPVSVKYSKFLELKTWDRFKIPYPFSSVNIIFNRGIDINEAKGEKNMENFYIYMLSDLMNK